MIVLIELWQKADEFLTTNKPFSTWNCADLKTVLKPLKRKGEKLASRKANMIAQYEQWKNRQNPVFESDAMPDPSVATAGVSFPVVMSASLIKNQEVSDSDSDSE